MKAVALRNLGRFGNQLFRYAYARALAEQNGYELRTDEWVGEKIFTLDGHEAERPDGTEELEIEGYCQNQESLIYSRADCRRWFELKPEVAWMLDLGMPPMKEYSIIHLRRGDYAGAGYPLVGFKAAQAAMFSAIGNVPYFVVTDEKEPGEKNGEFEMIQDFYFMTLAKNLFRANSSFSYWAGVLSHGRVFSPVITGLAGGVEHDNVPFVEGNHSRLAELPGITDLFLRES